MSAIVLDHPTVGERIVRQDNPADHAVTRWRSIAARSGDHNPIHVDIDFAKTAGFPDVFAHGMLVDGLSRPGGDRCGRAVAASARSRRALRRSRSSARGSPAKAVSPN